MTLASGRNVRLRIYVTIFCISGTVTLKTYSETAKNVVQSFVERYEQDAVTELLTLWEKDYAHFTGVTGISYENGNHPHCTVAFGLILLTNILSTFFYVLVLLSVPVLYIHE